MQVKATTPYLSISPQKLRLVIDQVRGKDAKQAVVILQFMPKKGAELVGKTLKSAIANAENNYDISADDLIVKAFYAACSPHIAPDGCSGRARGLGLWVVKFIQLVSV